MTGTVLTVIENNIATISFYHPSSNSFPSDQLNLLIGQFENLKDSPDVSVIVLKSEGKGAFCAGASFDELLSVSNESEGKLFFSGFANLINAMRTCNKLIIGRVHGKAVGGGLGIISACDYVFATSNCAIKLSEIAIGIGPFVIEPAVSRKIGKIAMSELALAPSEWKSAQWAFEKGMFAKLFNTTEEMDESLKIYIKSLSLYNPEALLEMKNILWENTSHWNELLVERALISGKLVLSNFTKKALSEFKK